MVEKGRNTKNPAWREVGGGKSSATNLRAYPGDGDEDEADDDTHRLHE